MCSRAKYSSRLNAFKWKLSVNLVILQNEHTIFLFWYWKVALTQRVLYCVLYYKRYINKGDLTQSTAFPICLLKSLSIDGCFNIKTIKVLKDMGLRTMFLRRCVSLPVVVLNPLVSLYGWVGFNSLFLEHHKETLTDDKLTVYLSPPHSCILHITASQSHSTAAGYANEEPTGVCIWSLFSRARLINDGEVTITVCNINKSRVWHLRLLYAFNCLNI